MGQMDRVVESASLAGPLLEPFAESPRGSGTLNHTQGGAWPSLDGHRRYRTQALAGRLVSVPDSDKCLEPPDGQRLGGPGLVAFFQVRVCLTFNSLQSLTLLTDSNPAFTRREFKPALGPLVSWGMGGRATLSPHSAMTARAQPPRVAAVWGQPTPTRDTIATLRPR